MRSSLERGEGEARRRIVHAEEEVVVGGAEKMTKDSDSPEENE